MFKIFSFLVIYVSTNVLLILCEQEMSINVIDGHRVDIYWQESLDNHLCLLAIDPISSKYGTESKMILLEGNHTIPVRVDGLTPGCSYDVRLIICGTQSNEIYQHKSFTTKPNPPKNLICSYYSEQSMQVIWDVPETPTMFDEYLVGINTRDSPKIVDKSETTHVFNGLIPGKVYNITVQTKSRYQLSEQLNTKCQTISASPANIWYDTDSLTSNSFLIRWTAPYMRSEFDSYLVNNRVHTEKDSRFEKFTEGIEPGKTYKIEVKTRSGHLTSKPVSCNVTTRPLPLSTLKSYPGNDSDVRIEWTVSPNSTQDSFIVTYWETNEYEMREYYRVLNKKIIDLKNLFPGRKYLISVAAVSNDILSFPTNITFPDDQEQISQQNMIVSIILFIIIIMIISIVLYVYYKKRIATSDKNLDDIEVNAPLNIINTENIELDQSLIIDRKDLKIMEKIGQGQFGTVHFAILTVRSGRVPIDVAIKMSNVIKNEKDMDEFLKEALIMKNFNHPNVLSLYGISFEPNGSPLVVLPFMKNRDVLKYIRNEENRPNVEQLMGFAIDVAKGMDYLSKQNFIHRDLAARNCMLDNDLNVKVADFGLSKATKDYYKNENSKQLMPIKWMSIESLEKGIYDTKTDVWSYGVLVWELMTRGIIPYPNMHQFEVLPYLRNGNRLPKPNFCPDLVYEILLDCWATNPKLTPTFEVIVKKLEELLETLLNISKSQAVVIENVAYYNLPISTLSFL